MQGCFHRHPETYGEELDEDEDYREEDNNTVDGVAPAQSPSTAPLQPSRSAPISSSKEISPGEGESAEVGQVRANREASPAAGVEPDRNRTESTFEESRKREAAVTDDHLVPKALHDTNSTDKGK